MPRTTMRLATYNVLHGVSVRDGGRVDLAAVADAIADLACDAVAVQEVDRGLPRTGHVDQVAWLAGRLGWHGVFAPALAGDPDRAWHTAPEPDRGGPGYGVGLLSRRPLTGARRTVLPGGGAGERAAQPAIPRLPWWPGWDREPRVALAADVTVDGRTVRLASTHLSYLPWRALAQLRAAARAIGGGTGVLLGDVNLPVLPASAALGRGWTAGRSRPTYPVWRPRLQADQVHVTAGVRLDSVATVPLGPSDHYPLVAEIAF